MKLNYLIGHKDLARSGYYFINSEQEKMLLESLNDEFAYRVGERLSEQLTNGGRNIPEADVAICEIRRELLRELKEKRKQILIAGAEH